MTHHIFSRRDFSRLFGQSLALAFATPRLPKLLDAQRHQPIPGEAIRLNYNENPYGPSPRALEALATCGQIANRYPDVNRLQVMDAPGAKIQRHFRQYRSRLRLHGNSALRRCRLPRFQQECRRRRTHLRSRSRIRPGLARSPVKIPLTADHRHDLPRMAAACTSKTGVVYVCNPNNPTGTIVTRDEMATFIQAVPSTTLILVDEAYYDFVDDPRYSSATEFIAKRSKCDRRAHVLESLRHGRNASGLRRRRQRNRSRSSAVSSRRIIAMPPSSPPPWPASADNNYVATCRARLNDTRRWLCAELTKDSRAFIPSHGQFRYD